MQSVLGGSNNCTHQKSVLFRNHANAVLDYGQLVVSLRNNDDSDQCPGTEEQCVESECRVDFKIFNPPVVFSFFLISIFF